MADNTSVVENCRTANTAQDVAETRAIQLSELNITCVLELCVGPSLQVLEEAYKSRGIKCRGNDIEERWQQYYPTGDWLIGDCFTIEWPVDTDAVVFAPPLSRGCTGCREDALMIEEVVPAFADFVHTLAAKVSLLNLKLVLLVLPARSLATKQDRAQLVKLEHLLQNNPRVSNVVRREARSGRRQIRKYVELYVHLSVE